MEERKFVCKYCSKRFPCGKSLGGHIRTHMSEERSNNNNAECENLNLDAVRMKKKRDLWCTEAGGYGLRENPKKTMRFVHSNPTLEQQDEKFCKECGKGFPSLKALCGHMACHSEKQKLVMDSQSDTETCAIPKHPRRSKRMKRFKTLSLNNGSSSVSEVEQEQEQEEVARCLMLLSQDSSHNHKGRFASVTESSDNNSVILEATKSSSADMRIGINNGKNFVSNGGYDLVKKKKVLKDIKLRSADNSDSGFFSYGIKTKIADSDFSNDEFKSEFEDYNVESRKMLNMNKDRSKYTVTTVFKKSVMEDSTRKFDSRKIANYDSFGHSKKTEKGFVSNDEIYETGRKECKYESLVYDSTDESDENSSDSDSFPAPKSHNSKVFNGKKKCSKAKKKLKSKETSMEYECPICYKIFKSGQALGGHKRSHFVGGSEENSVLIKQGAAPAVPCLIDLNLPAPVDE